MDQEFDSNHYFEKVPLAPVPPEDVIERLHGALADLPFIWRPFVPLGPVILHKARYRELAAVSNRLLDLLVQTVRQTGSDSRSRARALGMDTRLDELLVDQHIEDSLATWMSRPDVIPTSGGFKFIEFNVSAAVGGPNFNHVLQHAWYSIYGISDGSRLPFAAPDPFTVQTRSLDRICHQLGGERSIALIEEAPLVGPPHASHPPHAIYDVHVNYLTEQGYRVISHLPEQLAEIARRVPGSCTLAMKQLVPQDLLDEGGTVSTLREACQIAQLVLSPQSSYQVSNKKVLAMLSAGPDWMSGADRDFVAKYVPWTRIIRDGDVEYDGRRVKLAKLLADRKDQFVVKGATGNASREVWVGRKLDFERWLEVLDLAFSSEKCVVQEYVDSVPFMVRLWDHRQSQECERAVAGVLGPFIVDGANAGCQLRFALHEQKRIIDVRRAGVMFNSVAESRR